VKNLKTFVAGPLAAKNGLERFENWPDLLGEPHSFWWYRRYHDRILYKATAPEFQIRKFEER
jgi:hypothetical protein